MPITVIVGDGHPIVADGLARRLEPRFRVVRTCTTVEQLAAAIQEENPDLAIIDPRTLQGGWTPDLTMLIRRTTLLWVVLSNEFDAASDPIAREGNVAGWISKCSQAEDIEEILLVLFRSHTIGMLRDQDRQGVKALPMNPASQRKPQTNERSGRNLTPRQRQILAGIAQGKTSKEIAMELGVSPRTIDFHRAHISSRIGIKQVADLTRFAIQHGIVPTEPVKNDIHPMFTPAAGNRYDDPFIRHDQPA